MSRIALLFLVVFVTACVTTKVSPSGADIPQVSTEGKIAFPNVSTEGKIAFPKTVYAEVQNSQRLSERLRAHLAAHGVNTLDAPRPDAPRLSVYGYHSRDKSGQPGVVDFGRLYEGLLNGTADQVEITIPHYADAVITRTRQGAPFHGPHQADLGVAREAGKLLGSATQGYVFAHIASWVGNILETPEEGANDTYIQIRFLAQAGVNATQLWAHLIPAGKSPALLPVKPGDNVLRVTVRYGDDVPPDPVSLAIEALLSALAEERAG